jgi:hypothetical protein
MHAIACRPYPAPLLQVALILLNCGYQIVTKYFVAKKVIEKYALVVFVGFKSKMFK